MSNQTAATTQTITQVGPDRVTTKENEILIEAKNRMPDWQIREINPLPVYFNDRKYKLVAAGKAKPPYAVCYLLSPWPQDLVSSAKGFYNYDAESVADRESALTSGKLEEVGRACLLPFYPFLGLLWSRTQTRLSRFGFAPHTMSGVSIFLVFSLLFGQGVFAIVTMNSSMRSGKMMVGGFLRAISSHDSLHLGPVSIPIGLLDCLLAVALLADLAMRYTYYLREHDWSGGFLEWLVRRPSLESKTDSAA